MKLKWKLSSHWNYKRWTPTNWLAKQRRLVIVYYRSQAVKKGYAIYTLMRDINALNAWVTYTNSLSGAKKAIQAFHDALVEEQS